MNIAVIEDTLVDSDFYSLVLKRSGHNVFVFDKGEAFLRAIDEGSFIAPDIVLMDQNLGRGLNGVQVYLQTVDKPQFKQTRFVAISGFFDQRDREWLRFLGFDGVMEKPTTAKEINLMISNLGSQKKAHSSTQEILYNLRDAVSELSKLRLRKTELENNYIKKLISPQIFCELENNPDNLRPNYHKVAVGFVDIRSFTQLSNTLQINQINTILELFFEHVSNSVANQMGFLDKFMGDAVLWFHKAVSADICSKSCINAAVEILRGWDSLNERIKAKLHQDVPIACGIGASCGDALVGIFGDPKHRIQYSILGPTVNLASRLCGEARDNEFLVGGELIEYLPFKSKSLGFRPIKGFNHDIEVRLVVTEELSKITKTPNNEVLT